MGDRPRKFMTESNGEFCRDIAVKNAQVRPANSYAMDFDEYLIGLQFGDGHLLDYHFILFIDPQCFHCHSFLIHV